MYSYQKQVLLLTYNIPNDNVTDLSRLRFNFGEGVFLLQTAEGGIIRVNDEYFRNLATTAGARKALAGASTLKRAVFTHSLVQTQSREVRRAILADITRQLLSGRLNNCLYIHALKDMYMASEIKSSPAEQLAALLQIVRSPDFQESSEETARREQGQQRLKERLSLIPWYREQAAKDGEEFWRKLHGSCILS